MQQAQACPDLTAFLTWENNRIRLDPDIFTIQKINVLRNYVTEFSDRINCYAPHFDTELDHLKQKLLAMASHAETAVNQGRPGSDRAKSRTGHPGQTERHSAGSIRDRN